MSGPHPEQIRIWKVPPSTHSIYASIDLKPLVNTRDRVHLILLESIPRVGRPVALCLAVIGIAITLALHLLTGGVPRFGPIGPQHLPYYQMLLLCGLFVVLGYLGFLIYRHRNPLTIEDIVNAMQAESQVVSPWEPIASALQTESLVRVPWHYDFIDHFTEATLTRHPGSDIKVMPRAVCDGIPRRAIYEHPPEDAQLHSEVAYNVTPPVTVGALQLQGFMGILSELADTTPPRPSHRGAANALRFELVVNGEPLITLDKDSSRWESFSVRLPSARTLAILFRTNCLGDPQCNWAAWAEPEVVVASGH